jgi:GNAT superfamily N-acetyltransferase
MITIRKLLPAEYPAYAAHLKRLDPADRGSRFHAAVGDDTLDAHVAKMGWAETAIVGAFSGGEVIAAAELHDRFGDWFHAAEIAVTVEAEFQGRGLGSELVRRAVTIAKNRGMRRVAMICLRDNHRMRRIARHLPCRFVDEEGALTVAVDVGWPTPESLLQETIDDGLSVAMISLNAWDRALRMTR